MEGSIQRVETLLAGGKPDRGILYDKILNDAVIEYYGGEKITEESKRRVVAKAMREALDASNGFPVPVLKDYEDLYYGRKVIHQRWTKWVGPRSYPDLETYVKRKREEFNAGNLWTKDDLAAIPDYLAHNRELQEELRPTFWSWGSMADVGFMGFYTEVGLEQFSYYFADYPQLYQELLDYNVSKSILKFENLPEDHGIKLMHMGDDIAFKSGTIMPVDYMKKEYFPRLKKTIAASHKRGIKQIFHSDGNLMNILDDLVEAGIDGLHPIEVMAGMDIKEIHRRYPKLILVGGIDVSELLPFGKPQEIRDTVKRTFEDAEGMIMMGSSTEVHNAVPLGNFNAMREAVMECRY